MLTKSRTPYIIIVFIHHCYLDIINAKKYGFDPRNELCAFNMKEDYFACVTEHFSTYFQFNIIFLPLSFLNDLTFNRSVKCLKISNFCAFLILEVFEIAEYFTFFNNRFDGILFYGFIPESPITIFTIFVYILKIICLVPSFIYPASQTICNIVAKECHQIYYFLYISTFIYYKWFSLSIFSCNSGISIM